MNDESTSKKMVSTFFGKYLPQSQGKFIAMLVIAFLMGVGALMGSLWRLSSTMVESIALQNAVTYTTTLGAVRDYYATEVVERLAQSQVEVTHDYHEKTGAIPVPATLNIELGERITEISGGVQVRFYSDFPFLSRTNGGPKDDFERTALMMLRKDPEQPYYRFEPINDHQSLRYAVASIMQPSCVNCHNSHPLSPKTDWQAGDVRGVLEVIQPVDDAFKRVESTMQYSTILTIFLSLGGLVGLGSIIYRLNQNSLALAQYAVDLEHEIKERQRAEAEKLRLNAIQQEVLLARNLQQTLLPPVKPDWREIDAICYNRPAHGVSGDFYTYHHFPAQHGEATRYIFVVGDVTGKGMSAALLMSISLASFRSSIGYHLKPNLLMKHLDNILLDYTRATHQNCALVYVELEPLQTAEDVSQTRPGYNVLVTNAGCITPIVRRANGTVEWVKAFGLPLGVNAKAQFDYQTVTLILHPGDVIILSSDGVVETTDTENNMFGFEQLEQVVADGPTTTAQAMLTHLQEKVSTFAGGADQHDDLTVIVVKV